MGGGSPFLLGLGCLSKEADDEGDLPSDISFVHPEYLSLAVRLSPSPYTSSADRPGSTTCSPTRRTIMFITS